MRRWSSDPVTVTTHYFAPAGPGPVRIEVDQGGIGRIDIKLVLKTKRVGESQRQHGSAGVKRESLVPNDNPASRRNDLHLMNARNQVGTNAIVALGIGHRAGDPGTKLIEEVNLDTA